VVSAKISKQRQAQRRDFEQRVNRVNESIFYAFLAVLNPESVD
jgi:hypothetical protein